MNHNVGDKMPDGTIYAGISPKSSQQMCVMPADAPMAMTFYQAKEYAAKLDAHGRQDWRVPTQVELSVLFLHRIAIGGFNLTGSDPFGRYWSASAEDMRCAWGQRFSDGHLIYDCKDNQSSLRCVRLINRRSVGGSYQLRGSLK